MKKNERGEDQVGEGSKKEDGAGGEGFAVEAVEERSKRFRRRPRLGEKKASEADFSFFFSSFWSL